ncbi:MAG: peptide-methionine (S)-S-oxide reductase, partial [Desulfobacterales bacterium]|nr:peptide-methionine (S)-S-oxide reductase [Desulfobacterales bacterium]
MKFTTITIIALAIITLGYLPVFIGYGSSETREQTSRSDSKSKSAVFAGGCFWCTESDFEKVPGVTEVISGYTGGRVADPTYEQVSSGATGHVEAVKVIYDPERVTYAELLEFFWRH